MDISQAIEARNVNLWGLDVAERVDFVDGIDETLDDVVGCLDIVLDTCPKTGGGILQQLIHLDTTKESVYHLK